MLHECPKLNAYMKIIYPPNLTELFKSQVPHALDSPTFIVENDSPLTETSTVVSPFTPDALAESCPLDAPAESPDVHKCQEFV